MTTTSLHPRVREQLLARERALRTRLAAPRPAGEADNDEVHDFKDAADLESRLAVDDAAFARAEQDLAAVVAALRRLDAGSYGLCIDCGEPIDERRLLALPATALCADCQRVHEAR